MWHGDVFLVSLGSAAAVQLPHHWCCWPSPRPHLSGRICVEREVVVPPCHQRCFPVRLLTAVSSAYLRMVSLWGRRRWIIVCGVYGTHPVRMSNLWLVKEERREGCGSGPEEDTRRSLHWTVYTWLVIVFSRDIRLTDVAQSVAGESRGTGWKEAGQEVRARRHRKWPWRDFKKLCSLTETRGTASGGSVSHWPPVQRHSSWKCKEV